MKIHLQIIVVGVALLGLAGCDQSAKQPPASTEAVKESAAADAIKEDAGDIAGRIAEPAKAVAQASGKAAEKILTLDTDVAEVGEIGAKEGVQIVTESIDITTKAAEGAAKRVNAAAKDVAEETEKATGQSGGEPE